MRLIDKDELMKKISDNSGIYNSADKLQHVAKCIVEAPEIDKKINNDTPTSSQSEKDILEGCIGLMNMVYNDMIEYLNWMNFKYPKKRGDEGFPQKNYTYSKIVNRLFLWETHHSGSTSTQKKMQELGIDDDILTFEPEGRKNV